MEQSYKEKYEQALAKAKEQYNYPCMRSCMGILEEIFPELAESEDEKVRNGLVRLLKELLELGGVAEDEWDRNECEKYIAWLEKQEGCEYIKKDWLEHIKQSWYKEGLIDGKYSGGTSKEWTINDAATLKELIDFLENGTAKLQHDLTRYANWLKNQFTPIIERQGEQNFEMKTAEESLGIDSDTYNKIVDECLFGEQKQEWSEEDEINVYNIIHFLEEPSMLENNEPCKNIVIDWLKSIKDRVQPKQEWSEEDEKIINGLIDSLTRISLNTRTDSTSPNFSFYKEIDWLKSLRPQNRWKPSDEQMWCLSDAIEHYNSLGYPAPKLKELLDDLKKLKEGKV